jgi:hypothetical protein
MLVAFLPFVLRRRRSIAVRFLASSCLLESAGNIRVKFDLGVLSSPARARMHLQFCITLVYIPTVVDNKL